MWIIDSSYIHFVIFRIFLTSGPGQCRRCSVIIFMATYYCVIIYLSSKFSPSHCSTCSGSSATCAPCGICQYRSDSPEGPCRKFRDVVLVCVHIWASLDYVLHMLEMRFGEIDIISPKLTDKYFSDWTLLPFVYLIAYLRCSLINHMGA